MAYAIQEAVGRDRDGTTIALAARRRIGLVGCVKTKSSVPAPAGDLYLSPLFAGRRRAVEATCDDWFVLSALHGLVRPEAVLEPYDQALTKAGIPARRRWSAQVLADLHAQLGDLDSITFEIHAGAAYRDFGLVEGLRAQGAEVVLPGAGLSIGQQLAFYRRMGRR